MINLKKHILYIPLWEIKDNYMAKKISKPTKEESLETILFNCRNSLRGRAAMTDKRDLLLTLVFLKFIGDRFNAQKEKIRKEIEEVQGIHDEDFIQMQLNRPNHQTFGRQREEPKERPAAADIHQDSAGARRAEECGGRD